LEENAPFIFRTEAKHDIGMNFGWDMNYSEISAEFLSCPRKVYQMRPRQFLVSFFIPALVVRIKYKNL
jgi:hypothetical protein